MYPANQFMDPYYSYCRDHPPYPYYPPPGWEAGQRQSTMDSPCQPPGYGHLPYSGSTSHSHLPESHTCCNQTYPPGYYSHRPPFPQELPPPHLYYHGQFPHHLNTYPSYFVPPPPYPVVDQIPYGYGKFKGHCCGCPNHVCHGGEKNKLKIEEEMPDSEQKGADTSSIIGRPSYQYPDIWLPSGNMKDGVKGRSFEMPPQLFSKWFPESGEGTGDGKQQRYDNHNAGKSQWPAIWMPAVHDEPKQETKEFKEVDKSPKITKEAPHSPSVKIIPLSWLENDRSDEKPVARDGSGEHNVRSLATNQSAGAEHRHNMKMDRNLKTIPVVPGEVKNENKSAEKNCKAISELPDKEVDKKKVHTCRTIPVMVHKKSDEKASNVEKEGENRELNNVEKSKAKLSKLPPVCLRVDPLPRKKSGNRSSGSLNQATKKVCENENGMKEAQSKNQETKTKHSETNKESQSKECNEPVKEKSSEMDKIIGSRNVTVQDASVKPAQEKEISTDVDEKAQPRISVEARENASTGSLQECNRSTKDDDMKFQVESSKSAPDINLSEPDAAVCIQSAYRGYNVRRWRTLEKLQKVKKIHDQMQDLKKKLQGLEDASKQLTAREQIAINETIMNLLLNLDTIQGLHPSVREARKSVARELVSLQEKLDSLCKQLPSEPNQIRCENQEPERTDNAIQTTAHASTAEASEEAKVAGAVDELVTPSVNSSEMMNDEASSGSPKGLRQDAGSAEQKHEMEESSSTHDEGKAAPLGECQGTSSMDVSCDRSLPGHFTESKHCMEESNAMLREETSKREKAAAKGEGHEVSSVACVESLHDEQSSSEESSTLKQCPASTEQNSCTEDLNTGVSSSSATEDGTTTTASLPIQNGESVDKEGADEGQVLQSAALEISALKPDAASVTEDDRYREISAQFSQPCVYLKDAELHEHDTHVESTAFSPGGQPEEDANMQNHCADTMRDSSAKEPDGTPEPRAGDTESLDYAITAVAGNSVQSPLLEETPQSGSALLQESEAIKQCEVSCKDDPVLVEQPKEARLENEAKTMESNLHVTTIPSNMCAEPRMPESVSNESQSDHDGIMLHENPTDPKMSLESRRPSQNESVSEDAGIQMASEEAEAATVSATHGAVKNHEKNLADENLELKEMLQTLLASGNDQMGIITELSEKVRTLERKLTHKRRPKVRVYRPAKNASAKLH